MSKYYETIVKEKKTTTVQYCTSMFCCEKINKFGTKQGGYTYLPTSA